MGRVPAGKNKTGKEIVIALEVVKEIVVGGLNQEGALEVVKLWYCCEPCL